MLLARTRVVSIFNTLLKVVFISGSIRGWRKREMKQLLATVLVSFRSLSLPVVHYHFLVFSHQGHLPHLYSCSALDNLGWNSINLILIRYKSRMLHRLSHLVMLSRAAKRGPLQSLVSFSSSREASDCVSSLRLQ